MYSQIENQNDPATCLCYSLSLRLLTIALWIAAGLFGFFTATHYIKKASIFSIDHTQQKQAWDMTDPDLYRPDVPAANRFMLLHFLAGVVLMAAGPIQLIPYIRRRHLNIHRTVGRLYLGAAIMASVCATLFVIMFGTSRGNKFEDWGNILFGSLVLTCACQSYLHVKITGKIQFHKLWSWRLFALVIGALLYRLYVTVYFALVLYTPWNGSVVVYNSLYFLFYLPNLAVVELLWQRQQTKGVLEATLLLFCVVFVVVTSSVIFLLSWLPAIQGRATAQGQVLQDETGNG